MCVVCAWRLIVYTAVTLMRMGTTIDNGYIAPHNLELPGNRRVLTAKGLTGLNYVPKPDGVTISEKIEAQKPVASTAEGKSKLSELIGEMIGAGLASFTKTI